MALAFPRIRLVREKALTGTPEIVEMLAARRGTWRPGLGGTNLDLQRINSVFVQAQAGSYAYMYKSQPAVRAVVDYVARNVAQLGLKLYRRVSDDEREHVGDHPAAQTLRQPNIWTPGQKFVFSQVADFLVYDNAYALKFRPGNGGPLTMLTVPPHAVGVVGRHFFNAEAYRIWRADGTWFDVSPDDIVHWSGYDPEDPRMGFSKLETLRDELAADAAARAAKTELDRSGGMPKGWMERPLEADWTPEDRERFQAQWANWSKTPTRGVPVAEDGMQFKQASVSPEQAQMLESRQFTRQEVAAEYGLTNVPPESEEERRQVYADVLPPYCEMLCAYLDLHVLEAEFAEDDLYFEFNLDEKQMSDDRIKALNNAAGAPIFTRNEARSRVNLPALEGGDELVTPLNVMVGGKPSVGTMPVQDPNKPSQDGDHRTEEAPKALVKAAEFEPIQQIRPIYRVELERQHRNIDLAQATMERHFGRMERRIANKGWKALDWQRWNREFADDIFDVVERIVELEGSLYVFKLAGQDAFDMGRVQKYLRAMSEGAAKGINDNLRALIEEHGIEGAFALRDQHVQSAGAGLGAGATRWAREEAARQAPNTELRSKSWVANTQRHAEWDGTTVPLGADWPAGFAPGAAPNCRCTQVIS